MKFLKFMAIWFSLTTAVILISAILATILHPYRETAGYVVAGIIGLSMISPIALLDREFKYDGEFIVLMAGVIPMIGILTIVMM